MGLKNNNSSSSRSYFVILLSLEHLNLGIDTGRERKILQRINRLWCGVRDINQALVDFHFESLAASLVDMWRFHDGKRAALSRQRHWTRDGRTGANRSINDLLRALVNHAVVVRLEANTNLEAFIFLGFNHIFLSSPYNLR